jgi:hypothetical protein
MTHNVAGSLGPKIPNSGHFAPIARRVKSHTENQRRFNLAPPLAWLFVCAHFSLSSRASHPVDDEIALLERLVTTSDGSVDTQLMGSRLCCWLWPSR